MSQQSEESNSNSYRFEINRVNSFINWPHRKPTAKELAAAGFYFCGTSDLTCCFDCNIQIAEWDTSDRPLDEHRRFSSPLLCRFLSKKSDNVPIGGEYVQPKLTSRQDPNERRDFFEADIPTSLSSNNVFEINKNGSGSEESECNHMVCSERCKFYNGWILKPTYPKYNLRTKRIQTFFSFKSNPTIQKWAHILANSGFILRRVKKPELENLDKVLGTIQPQCRPFEVDGDDGVFVTTCYWCGGSLAQWPEDMLQIDPYNEHAIQFPKCKYIHDNGHQKHRHMTNTKRILLTALDNPDDIYDKIKNEGMIVKGPFPVKVLQTYYYKTNNEEKSAKEKLQCKICYVNDSDIIFEPCHHVTTCHDCALKIEDCPICRCSIAQRTKCYII